MHQFDRHPTPSLKFVFSAVAASLSLAGAGAASSPITTMVSKATGGEPPQCATPEEFCYSVHPDITPDGRYVVYASVVPNLVPGPQTTSSQILRHDLHTCTTIRLSQTPLGQPADKPCHDPQISADGSFVAFSSRASNLAPGVPALVDQIYIYDESTGAIALISKSSSGVAGNAASSTPRISADGRWVVFQSDASNLVPGDTNAATDIFVYDRLSDELQRVSVGTGGVQGNSASRRPHMSDDGRFVVFDSAATTLTDDTFTSGPQIFLLDRDSNETGIYDEAGGTAMSLQSVNNAMQPASGAVWWPTVSNDGQMVAFSSTASNLVPGDTNNAMDIFIRNRAANTTTRESVGPGGAQVPSGSWYPTRFTDDGRYLTFHSPEPALVAGEHNGMTHVIRRDLQLGENIIISRNSDGELADSSSEVGIPNASGDVIAFTSAGNNMIPGGSTNPNWVNTYVRRLSPADLDGNGAVDVADLLLLLSHWGPGDCTTADLNLDGAVDVADLLVLLSAWG